MAKQTIKSINYEDPDSLDLLRVAVKGALTLGEVKGFRHRISVPLDARAYGVVKALTERSKTPLGMGEAINLLIDVGIDNLESSLSPSEFEDFQSAVSQHILAALKALSDSPEYKKLYDAYKASLESKGAQ
jgi:hypothetical protein